MGSTPITDIIQSLEPIEEELAIQVTMGALISVAPFFNIPIVNTIIEYLITKLLDFVIGQLSLFEVNLATIVETGMQESAFSIAAEANYQAQNGGTDAQKQQAQTALWAAARNLIQLNQP